MKKLLILTTALLVIVGMAISTCAADTLTTTATANVNQYASFTLINKPATYRSMSALTFETADGSKTWYYNALATLDPITGDPNDNKSDVGLGVKSNVPFTLKIHKTMDSLNGKIGYFVDADSAYSWDGSASVGVPGEVPGSGFDGTGDWGAIPSSSAGTLIYDSGPVGYADFQMGVNFALVPLGLAVGSHTTTITYTMTAAL